MRREQEGAQLRSAGDEEHMGWGAAVPQRLRDEQVATHVTEAHGIVGVDGDLQRIFPHVRNIGMS
ncbi:MAG TPA: hypothetical protein VFP10_03445, partial [Candidatus Eisenbacteria bacterium]|nr:hypothetical protein [Candidatus Eisenbacteria bacterium]